MKFGTQGLRRDTPAIVKSIRDKFIYAISGLLTFTAFIAPRLHMDGTDFATTCGLAIFGVKVIANFFGVSDTETVKNAVNAIDEVKNINP